MNIVELRDRLTSIIEENERRGWGERNGSDVVVGIKVSKRVTEYRRIKYAHGAWLGLIGENTFELISQEPEWRYGCPGGAKKLEVA